MQPTSCNACYIQCAAGNATIPVSAAEFCFDEFCCSDINAAAECSAPICQFARGASIVQALWRAGGCWCHLTLHQLLLWRGLQHPIHHQWLRFAVAAVFFAAVAFRHACGAAIRYRCHCCVSTFNRRRCSHAGCYAGWQASMGLFCQHRPPPPARHFTCFHATAMLQRAAIAAPIIAAAAAVITAAAAAATLKRHP